MSSEPSLQPMPVLAPSTDGPAMGDQATGWAFQRLRAVMRQTRIMIPAVLAVMVLLVIGASTGNRVLTPQLVLAPLLIVLLAAAWWRAERRVGRYLPRVRRMLAAQEWRPVPARLVVSGDRAMPVIELGDGSGVRLRLLGAPLGAQYVLARHGRVWLVGPDEGVAVVRIDGITGLILAHRTSGPREESLKEPLLPPVPYTGSAADDVVASWLASRATRVIRLGLIVRVGVFALAFVIGVVVSGGAGPGQGVVFGTLFVVLLCVILARSVRSKRKNVARLPELLRSGPWQQVQARFESWSPGRGAAGVAPARGELDGVAVTIPQASIDLMTYARETGTLWIAGRPEPGRTAAVGVAGYPVLGVAKFRA